MATRATYRIANNYFNSPAYYLYGHWDGHESCAAIRFKRALEDLQTVHRGSLAEALLRVDNMLELAICHDAYRNTEYRYNLYHCKDEVRLEAWHIDWQAESWIKIFDGKVEDFIQTHLPVEEQQP